MKKEKLYKSIKGDKVDEAIAKLINKYEWTVPIIRIY